jgi:hypothetical protein
MNLNECIFSLELVPVATINDVNKAYKRLMLQWHPDKYQSDEKLRLLAEQKTKEINVARDWLVSYFKSPSDTEPPESEMVQYSLNVGKVSDFINEFCTLNPSTSTEKLDLYTAYRDWCIKRHLNPMTLKEVESAVAGLGYTLIKIISGITETLCWKGIELPGYWYFMNDPDNFLMPYASDLDPNYVEPKEYADMDDDDDLGEVVF